MNQRSNRSVHFSLLARRGDRDEQGFSLIEMLVVISILAIVATSTISLFSATMKSGDLAQSSQFLNDQITLARQTALAKNTTVEVRFYQYADPSLGEQSGNPSGGKFRAVQLFLVTPGQSYQTAKAFNKATSLPHTIIIDSNASLSTLMAASQDKSGSWSSTDPQVSIPPVGTSYNCRYFQFYPDGSTSLTGTSLWFATLHATTAGDNLTTPPANFATLEVDSNNGHVQILRP